jgi:hypothetical protein
MGGHLPGRHHRERYVGGVAIRVARRRVPLLAVLAGGLAAPAHAEEMRFTCRNPSSGATWGIEVHEEHSLADSFPGPDRQR